MDKRRGIKKLLAGLSIASLIASIGLFPRNCKAQEKASCGAGAGNQNASTEVNKTSCGKGSLDTTNATDTGKTSCGNGTNATDTGKTSCGKGSCGK